MMFDLVLTFARVIASSISGEAKAVLYNYRAWAPNDAEDDTAEGSNEEAPYGALGLIARPRAPNAEGQAEAIAARTDDGLVGLAHRDLRISRARGNVSESTITLAHYGGAFFSLDDAGSGGGSIITLYAPYAFAGDGSPAHAHAVILDTTGGNESLMFVHGDGHGVIANHVGEVMIKNRAGDAFVSVADDGIALNGPVKAVTGMLAGDVTTAQPVVLFPAFALWMAQVNAAITVLQAHTHAVTAAPGTTGPPTPAPAPPAAVPLPSTKLSASP